MPVRQAAVVAAVCLSTYPGTTYHRDSTPMSVRPPNRGSPPLEGGDGGFPRCSHVRWPSTYLQHESMSRPLSHRVPGPWGGEHRAELELRYGEPAAGSLCRYGLSLRDLRTPMPLLTLSLSSDTGRPATADCLGM
jgi:hypothetical protein